MVLILDCNIWITLTLNSELAFIVSLHDKGYILPTCGELKNEIKSVLTRPKISKFISDANIEKAVTLHDLITRTYKVGKLVIVTADPKDDYLFALALKAKADYLVTGDKLLLSVVKYKRTQIITLAQLRLLIESH